MTQSFQHIQTNTQRAEHVFRYEKSISHLQFISLQVLMDGNMSSEVRQPIIGGLFSSDHWLRFITPVTLIDLNYDIE